MFSWLKRIRDALAAAIWLVLLADLIHMQTHWPYSCSAACPWPWGRRVPGMGLGAGKDG